MIQDRSTVRKGLIAGAVAVVILLAILLVGGGVDLFLGFFATLFATLIGVGTAFWLDRQAEQQRTKERVLNHLRALRQEMEMNEDAAEENRGLLGVLSGQQRGRVPEADHFVLSMFAVDAWDAALQEQLLDVVPPDLYHDLQRLYAQVRSTNELIRRLRSSSQDMVGGRPDDRQQAFLKNVDYAVAYWDADDEEVDVWMLGILIELRCREIKDRIGDISGSLDDEIDRIELELESVE